MYDKEKLGKRTTKKVFNRFYNAFCAIPKEEKEQFKPFKYAPWKKRYLEDVIFSNDKPTKYYDDIPMRIICGKSFALRLILSRKLHCQVPFETTSKFKENQMLPQVPLYHFGQSRLYTFTAFDTSRAIPLLAAFSFNDRKSFDLVSQAMREYTYTGCLDPSDGDLCDQCGKSLNPMSGPWNYVRMIYPQRPFNSRELAFCSHDCRDMFNFDQYNEKYSVPLVLLGLETPEGTPQVTVEEANELATKCGCPFIKGSLITGENVWESFEQLFAMTISLLKEKVKTRDALSQLHQPNPQSTHRRKCIVS